MDTSDDPKSALLTPEAAALVGFKSGAETACDAVEVGAIRRYAQAIMDDDRAFWDPDAPDGERYGGVVAPLLFPTHCFRRPGGTPDPLTDRAADPHFDGITGSTSQGLPPLPLGNLGLLNGGLEVEFFRHARPGEKISSSSQYVEIAERVTSKGPMVFVVIETEYRANGTELLLRGRKTLIRR